MVYLWFMVYNGVEEGVILKKIFLTLFLFLSICLTGCDFLLNAFSETAELDESDFTFVEYELLDETDGYYLSIKSSCIYTIYEVTLDTNLINESNNVFDTLSITLVGTWTSGFEFEIRQPITQSQYESTEDIEVTYSGWAYVNSNDGLIATYRVTYIFNNGADNLSIKVNKGDTITAIDDPVKEGLLFSGWYTESTFQNLFEFNTKIEKNTYLFAYYITDVEEYINEIKDEILLENITVETTCKKQSGLIVTTSLSTGSGVIFHETDSYYYFLTNNHVTYASSEYTSVSYRVMDCDYIYYSNVTILHSDANYDLSVGMFKKSNKELQVATLATTNPTTNTDIIAVGQPNGATNTVSLGSISKYTFATVSATSEESNVNFSVIMHTAETATGSSGGGIYNSELIVVAIAYAGATNTSGDFVYSLAVPIEKVHEFLDLNFWSSLN